MGSGSLEKTLASSSMVSKFVVEYAKSGRSSCKKCLKAIALSSLRLGLVSKNDRGFDTTKWHHLNCFPCINPESISSVEAITGFSFLKTGDQESIKKLLIGGASKKVDGSLPEWHAAHLANLKTPHTFNCEEFKKNQKDGEMRQGELEANKDKMMGEYGAQLEAILREYGAQLDVEMAHKLAHGKTHSNSKSCQKRDNDKDPKKHSSKKRKIKGASSRAVQFNIRDGQQDIGSNRDSSSALSHSPNKTDDQPRTTADMPMSPSKGLTTSTTQQQQPSTSVDPVSLTSQSLEPASSEGHLVDESHSQHGDLIHLTPHVFYTRKEVIDAIKDIITNNYNGSWVRFSDVPLETKQFWFQKFKNQFTWHPTNKTNIEKIFKRKASEFIRKHLHRARLAGKKPKWILQEKWDDMLVQWRQDTFKATSDKNKANRVADAASASTIYRGGSISMTAHSVRLERKMGRPPTPLELYSKVWKNKDGEWCGPRAQTQGEIMSKLHHGQSTRNPTSSKTEGGDAFVSSNEMLLSALGGFKKGRLPGMGSEAKTLLSLSHSSGSPSTAPVAPEINILREKLQQNELELQETRTRLRKTEEKLNQFVNLVSTKFNLNSIDSVEPPNMDADESDDGVD